VSDVSAPAEGDTFEADGTVYVIQGEPVRDLRRARLDDRGTAAMRLQAATQSDLNALLKAELGADERAVTAGTQGDGRPQDRASRPDHRRRPGQPARQHVGAARSTPRAKRASAAAGYVWSKAPGLVRLYADGGIIRSRHRQKITPGAWQRIHGLRLRFVYRRGSPSLLVAGNARLAGRGRAAANIGRSKAAAYTRLWDRTTVPVFILVPQVTVRKRLDVDGAARKWIRALPQLVLRNPPA
jgi:hypothetical protein